MDWVQQAEKESDEQVIEYLTTELAALRAENKRYRDWIEKVIPEWIECEWFDPACAACQTALEGRALLETNPKGE